MDYISYLERLGLGFNDKEKQQIFLNKMYNVFSISKIAFPHKLESVFASEIGLCFNPRYSNDVLHQPVENFSNPWRYIGLFKEFGQRLAAIVSLINLFKKIDRVDDSDYLYQYLIYAFESSHIQYQVESDEDGIFVFPKGDPFLDEGEVMKPLFLLNNNPEAKKSYICALRMYNNLDDSNASNVADQLRKALESFFQDFFKSAKSLENLKSDYGRFLKGKGVSPELSVNLVNLLSPYAYFNNNNAKHHDKKPPS